MPDLKGKSFTSQGSRGIKKPYISSPFGWGLDGGSQRIYRATKLRSCFQMIIPNRAYETKNFLPGRASISTMHKFFEKIALLSIEYVFSCYFLDKDYMISSGS
jgi:hypothetical protein